MFIQVVDIAFKLFMYLACVQSKFFIAFKGSYHEIPIMFTLFQNLKPWFIRRLIQ